LREEQERPKPVLKKNTFKTLKKYKYKAQEQKKGSKEKKRRKEDYRIVMHNSNRNELAFYALCTNRDNSLEKISLQFYMLEGMLLKINPFLLSKLPIT